MPDTGRECMCCERSNDAEDMVCCDGCGLWAHYSCVGVDATIKKQPWKCSSCTNQLQVPKPTKSGLRSNAGSGKASSKTSTKTDATLVESFKQLEKEHKEKEKALEEERQLREKLLEMERSLRIKQMAQEKELRQKELDLEREMKERQLEQDREYMEKRLAKQKEFQKRRESYNMCLKQYEEDEEGAVGGVGSDSHGKVEDWLRYQKPEHSGKVSAMEQDAKNLSSSLLHDLHNLQMSSGGNGGKQLVEMTPEESRLVAHLLENHVRNGSGPTSKGPTQGQLAARQSCSKQLPIFKGEAELWPIFISSYESTTKACGFTNLDNLKRLQDCLQGDALEAVRSRLILPELVPSVIQDLRDLFGKPETLLKVLILKLRQARPPRMDRLDTFIHFGMTVKQLCDHLEAANFKDHLNNPMLVEECVDKLPQNYQIEWIRLKREQRGQGFRFFADFMNSIVADVCELNQLSSIKLIDSSSRFGKDKQKKKEYFHLHNDLPSRPDVSHNAKVSTQNEKPCFDCRRTDHKIRYCEDFKKRSVSERFRIVEKNKLCRICLNNHGKSRCNFRLRCNVGNCGGDHHSLLHRAEEIVQLHEISCNAERNTNLSVIFRMMTVTLYAGSKSMRVLAFFDEGSSGTLIEDSIIKKLAIDGEPEPLIVTWTGNIKRYENSSKRVSMMISSCNSDEKFLLEDARTVAELVLPRQGVKSEEIKRQFKYLEKVPISDYSPSEPKLMIGLNNLHLFAPIESRIGQQGEPICVRSKLGWSVYGPRNPTTNVMVNIHTMQPMSNEQLHDAMRNQYFVEESAPTAGLPESDENRRARELMQATTVRVGDSFETGLLWRDDGPHNFPDSYPMAMRRLTSLERKLNKDPALKRKVDQQIEEYQLKNYAHKAAPNELLEAEITSTWYLPLNVVLNPRKPGKVRLVWDAAAAVNGTSLNSKLLKGPDLLASLPAVIQRFRQKLIGFGGDIKEMYHQIRIRSDDKQAQRFLYRFNQAEPPTVYIMDVATFGSTCSPSSAQFIKNLNASEFATEYPDAVKAIVENHYVDDYFDSVDSTEEAVQRAREVRMIHLRGGFQIRNWVSNSQLFLENIGETSTNDSVLFRENKNTDTERVLGISWDPKADFFYFSTTPRLGYEAVLSGVERPSKRSVLSCVMAMFDPLGLLAIFTVHGKIIMQDLWRTGCGWDDPIDDESFEKWKRWTELLPAVGQVRIQRSYFGSALSKQIESLQLHVFTDASEQAYGCVAYFRVVVEGKVHCSLVMSRSKVAPLALLSIPRLELEAAVLGARMIHTVRNNHSIEIPQAFVWTDSQTVLSWIRSDHRRYKQFVGFRIGEILKLTSPSDWRWVPTKLNEADRLTKWRSDSGLHSNSAWFKGPEILYRAEHLWPAQRNQNDIPTSADDELRAQFLFHDVFISQALIDVQRFSKWNILVRTVAVVHRFISNCRKKVKGMPIETLKATERQEKLLKPLSCTVKRVPLKQEEFQAAETYLFRMAQADIYADELKILKKNQDRPSNQWIKFEKSSPLYKLTPLIDDNGIIRMEGRTERASFLPFDLRFPIILPKQHPVTTKIVHHYHDKFGHGNRETVKNELKQRFAIASIGVVVKKAASACQWCKVRRCKPNIPRMAALPVQRLIPYHRPFSYTGIDYLGPIEVTVGRRREKRWVVVFTCFVTRAIHLEVSYNLTTQSCLMAIRRFTCRRGPPLEFFSDNGTNLKAASKVVTAQIRSIDEDCAEELTTAQTKWNFNPPAAPHMGGVWERLVRSVKDAMFVFEDGKRLTDEILHTTIVEAEDVINSRPLVCASSEISSGEMLTPNHFIRGVTQNDSKLAIPPPHSAEALRDTFKRSQQLLQNLWARWIKEYVPSLNQRTKWFGEAVPLQKGDLVFVVDGGKRKAWVRGVVEEPITSSDGRIRQAWVRTNSGRVRRATAQLAVVEIHEGNAEPKVASGPELRVGGMLRSTPLGSTDGPVEKIKCQLNVTNVMREEKQ
ncbi:uncharacterized protein LOC129742295 [Uranotaenia lowii]|uniref:uncharacterized protein LOC129742295 n=1 Tax=Uranotaenia lowii TaxID=190385 RepID=UPI002479C33A|nr:uncharacterized protein LOC129742295 [Uranotaenia lowii]